jgi:hypothetical protein
MAGRSILMALSVVMMVLVRSDIGQVRRLVYACGFFAANIVI